MAGQEKTDKQMLAINKHTSFHPSGLTSLPQLRAVTLSRKALTFNVYLAGSLWTTHYTLESGKPRDPL